MLKQTTVAHLQKGKQAEQLALAYLKKQGLHHVCSNYRCKMGELDLVMKDASFLVIIEVRYRKSNAYGGALASVTAQKQARIIAATQHYVIIHHLSPISIRFDVIAITGENQIEWIKNAFLT